MSYDELLRDMERALVAIDASKPYRYEPTTSLPALSPQMQAALDAEAELVASVVKRARSIAAELLAARAENEQLRARLAVLRRTGERVRKAYELDDAEDALTQEFVTSLDAATPEWKKQASELLDRHKETP